MTSRPISGRPPTTSVCDRSSPIRSQNQVEARSRTLGRAGDRPAWQARLMPRTAPGAPDADGRLQQPQREHNSRHALGQPLELLARVSAMSSPSLRIRWSM